MLKWVEERVWTKRRPFVTSLAATCRVITVDQRRSTLCSCRQQVASWPGRTPAGDYLVRLRVDFDQRIDLDQRRRSGGAQSLIVFSVVFGFGFCFFAKPFDVGFGLLNC